MKRSSENKLGKLYIISTPIGNLKDITYRAVEVLKEVDFLFCEDTRVSSKLLNHYGIDKKTDSFHDFSDSKKEDYIISLLESGSSVGLISDCGTPLINDPGYEVCVKAKEKGIDIIPVPGASACLSALIKSALPPKPFMFYGFLDHKESKKKEELETLKNIPSTLIFYESPNRIHETLKIMYEVFNDRMCSLSRELTKMYEESINFNLSEYENLPNDLKGEMVIVIEGYKKESENKEIDIIKEIDVLIQSGMSLKESSKILSSKINLKSSEIYNYYLRNRK